MRVCRRLTCVLRTRHRHSSATAARTPPRPVTAPAAGSRRRGGGEACNRTLISSPVRTAAMHRTECRVIPTEAVRLSRDPLTAATPAMNDADLHAESDRPDLAAHQTLRGSPRTRRPSVSQQPANCGPLMSQLRQRLARRSTAPQMDRQIQASPPMSVLSG